MNLEQLRKQAKEKAGYSSPRTFPPAARDSGGRSGISCASIAIAITCGTTRLYRGRIASTLRVRLPEEEDAGMCRGRMTEEGLRAVAD
jgi:hypothetical protein